MGFQKPVHLHFESWASYCKHLKDFYQPADQSCTEVPATKTLQSQKRKLKCWLVELKYINRNDVERKKCFSNVPHLISTSNHLLTNGTVSSKLFSWNVSKKLYSCWKDLINCSSFCESVYHSEWEMTWRKNVSNMNFCFTSRRARWGTSKSSFRSFRL